MSSLGHTALVEVVETYEETGEPVSTRTLAHSLQHSEAALSRQVESRCAVQLLAETDEGYRPTVTAEALVTARLDIEPPDIRQVLLDPFGLPKPGLETCLCVIGEGPLPPSELADRLDYDESTVRRYLNELVEFGLLEKSQLNRESGGFVNVSHSVDLAEMREETLVGFYAWAGEAASLIEEANLTKTDYREADGEAPLTEAFWERFRDRTSGE